jgi:threonine dehydrogenase-like Zn-dependent dehydrogenase
VPFNISCGHCWMCDRGLFAQCETTQNRDQGTGASLFGYTELYGRVPGGQAELVRVPHADFGPVKLPQEGADERYLYLSDILPTAWQGVKWADVPEGGSLAIVGLGPVGQLAVRSAKHLGIPNVIGLDLVPDRLEKARQAGATVLDVSADGIADAVRDLTEGRGPDGVLEAVGMEAHGNPIAERVIGLASRMPKAVAQPMIENAGIDRLAALTTSFEIVRRGGTVSISGVYGGAADPLPMFQIFDKGVTLRMGQCHVRQWTDELFTIADQDDDVLGLETFATHHAKLDDAPDMYSIFQEKKEECLKVVLTP